MPRSKLSAAQYKRLTREVFERDGWACRRCKNRNDLHAHHVVYRSAGGKDERSNLLTVCAACHEDVHEGRIAVDVLHQTTDKPIGWLFLKTVVPKRRAS